ncbi:hypothetical protein F9K88_05255 [Brucella intermedia]|uniref:Lipoprotein n=1 Tax=Brucella ciceri TaxID=391287 RepID=A0ABX1DT13_9HYPH|nr:MULTISPECIES: hypothetical protein [Brucella/Ochrobactrum group]NKC27781.1 hypothetical protein [Brucella ciceri]PJT27507.1 hypothetical protein CN884_03730 [Ochrobactrum sp. 30A/1000/2015]PJT39048.1 hypothetical protein CN883_09900 [Ochrobactrum sp. 27A/999/2015]PJT44944.1 hypothetical protein CN882_03730 [Ochrobactrum sp. 23A/997/2015]KAB2714980.1 hypothetical protein F9K88_05255 [Brucella intermedia]
MRVFLFAGLLTLATGGVGFAASCEQNFKSDGVPLVTSVSYRSTQSFTGVKSSAALQRLAQAIAAEGFSGIKVNKQLASIEAFQETTGSGRIQTLRVTARAQGKSTRVDAIFTIQAGQATSKSVVREGLCRIIASAAN